MSRFRRKRSRTRSSCGPRLDWGNCCPAWARRHEDDEILITSPQLRRSRSDMSYDVAGLGLGGEKKKGKRRMYLYAGGAVVVIGIVIVAVWWTYYRMRRGPVHSIRA